MKRRNNAFANRVANPVVANLDVFRTFVYRVVKINQCNGTLAVDAEVDRFVVDKLEFAQECTEQSCRLRSTDCRDIFGFGSGKQNSSLFSRTPGETSAVEHEGEAGYRFPRVRIVRVVGITVCGDLRVPIRTICQLVVCCASQVAQDPFDCRAVSRLQVRHELRDLLNRMSDIRASHNCGVHERTDD